MNYSLKGSEWRQWDLHIHAPETKLNNAYGTDGEVWDKYLKALEASNVQAFGITDYFSADGYLNLLEKYRAKYPNGKKIFFPNIEFRLYESISADHKNPHIHVIFSNDEAQCPKNKIGRFLSNLETYQEDQHGVKIKCSDLETQQQFEEATVSLKGIKESLSKTFGSSHPYLIVFPAKNDGVRSTDSKSPRKVLITDQIDKDSHLFFGGADSRDYFLRTDRYENGKSQPKPVVGGSDAHSFNELDRLEGNIAGFLPTWIKADLTFRGLKQTCFEPKHRVFIGTEPPVEQRRVNQATKFLSSLKIDQVKGYSGANGQWFKDVEIPFNPELTAIIGNKGSGKSALVDIVGLLGESRQSEHFSFLTDKGNNKKFRKKGYSENFIGTLTWESTGYSTKMLNDDVDSSKPEAVRYLPQNYFEQLTNEIEIESFRKEIEDVVFSHVEETDRLGKTSFAELQNFKTQQIKHETGALKASLSELNKQIIQLEEVADPLYKKKLEEQLKAKKEELSSLEKAKPNEIKKPEEETQEQQKLSNKIANFLEKQSVVTSEGKNVSGKISNRKAELQTLTSLLQSVSSLQNSVDEQKNELRAIGKSVGIDIDVVIKQEITLKPINAKILDTQNDIELMEKDSVIQFNDDFDFSSLVSQPDLRAAYTYIQGRVEELKERLGAPQRKYQIYLEKLATWEASKKSLIGEKINPASGTVNYLEDQISYIETELAGKISEISESRKEIAKKIYDTKRKVLGFYSELKKSVDEKLGAVRTDGFSVDIESSFIAERNFSSDFLGNINKTRKGPFHGANEPDKIIRGLLSEVDWNKFDSIISFIDEVFNKMSSYKGEDVRLSDQVNNKQEFYDFLFSFDYFKAKYELRSAGKNLNELSPGEKGLLLLVFYLQLDKDNIPLVIDQPEDNLDNDSIFAVLAECIRQAKKNRQVILVTHNPNLAVGADAEQVVYVKLDKADNYKFTYETGSIENPEINAKIVLVLEGSQPAFIKRRLKYEI